MRLGLRKTMCQGILDVQARIGNAFVSMVFYISR